MNNIKPQKIKKMVFRQKETAHDKSTDRCLQGKWNHSMYCRRLRQNT